MYKRQVLSVTPTQANKLINLATTDITSDETDYYGFSDVAAGGVTKKILKSNMRNDFAADETKKWMVERATDAEAAAWTDTTRYITPKQWADNYSLPFNWTETQMSLIETATWTEKTWTGVLVSANSIWYYTVSIGSSSPGSAFARVETSSDNITYSTLYSLEAVTDSKVGVFPLQWGLYYRLHVRTWWTAWSSSATLMFTQ